jgi:hypothetical protein
MASGTKQEPKPQTKASGDGSKRDGGKPKAETKPKPPKYGEVAKRVSDKARRLACADTLQGPIPKQSHDVMTTLTEGPQEALKSVGVTQKEARAIATGNSDPKTARKLAPLAERVRANGGAPQWTRGKYLAATLVAWLDEKK